MTVRIVTLAGDPEEEAVVAAALEAHPDADLYLRCMDRVELLASIRAGAVDAVVSVGAPVWFDAQCAHEAASSGVVVVGIPRDPLEAEVLDRRGAVLAGRGEDAGELVELCLTRDAPPPEPVPAPQGRIVSVWGPKGAPGRTTVAIELAHVFAQEDPLTLLVDADTHGGDVAQRLGILEDLPDIVWASELAARTGGMPDGSFADLRRAGAQGPVLLDGIHRPDLWSGISAFGWARLLEGCSSAFTTTIVDVGSSLQPPPAPPGVGGDRDQLARAAVSASQKVVAVVRGDPIGLKHFAWSYDLARDLFVERDLRIVVNGASSGDEAEIRGWLADRVGGAPVIFVPWRPADMSRALAAGATVGEVRPRSDVCRAMRELAALLGAKVPPFGLLSRMVSRAAG